MDELTCSFRGVSGCVVLVHTDQGVPWPRISENQNPYSQTCLFVKQQPRNKIKQISNYFNHKFLVFVKVQVNFYSPLLFLKIRCLL